MSSGGGGKSMSSFSSMMGGPKDDTTADFNFIVDNTYVRTYTHTWFNIVHTLSCTYMHSSYRSTYVCMYIQ